MRSPAEIHILKNGLALIVQEIGHVESVAYSLHIPAGILTDAEESLGSSLILAELTSRGAGSFNSRELSEQFDNLGVRHSEGAGLESTTYSGSLLAENLPAVLKLVASMVRQATLPEEEVENIKSLLLQDISSMLDNPARRVMHELRARYYGAPYNRSTLGTEQGINACTRETLADSYRQRFTPLGSVLSIAGKVKCAEVVRAVEREFSEWSGIPSAAHQASALAPHRAYHLALESAQLQIAFGYPSAKFGDADYYNARVANTILSGGMFGRLFIEVREKRGLCYSVYSQHSGSRDEGSVFVYAGTTAERAQETMDVLLKELRGVRGTVTEEELKRAKANLKAGLLMSQESSGSRAHSNSTDWWWSKRVRSFEEIEHGIASVTGASIDAYLDRFPGREMTLVTLGAKSLELPQEV